MLFVVYSSPEFKWISLGHQVKAYIEMALLFFSIGLVVSVLFTLAIGWPLYLLAMRLSTVNYFTCAFGGVCVTTVPYVFSILLGWMLPQENRTSEVTLIGILMFCGACSGVVFHMLELRNSK